MTRDDTTGRRLRPWSDTAPDARRRLEDLVDEHEGNDQPLEAIAVMERVVDMTPDEPMLVDRLARLYDRAGAWMKAAEAFEQVARLAPDDRARAALRAAARLYRANGQRDRAAAMYRAIVTRRPTDLEAWRALDEVLEELAWWPDLADVRGALAERAGDAVERAALLRGQARALESAGDAPGAARVLAEAARLAPEDLTALVEQADLMLRRGRGAEARRLLEELLGRTPNHVPALQRLASLAERDPDPRAYAEARLRHAGALTDSMDKAVALLDGARWLRDRVRDRAAAARIFEEAVGLLEGDEEARNELEEARAALLVERAAADARAGETGTAERRLRAVLASRPHDLDANLALAQLYTELGRLDDAAELLRDALAAAPESVEPERLAPLVHRYAVVVAARGDAEEAHKLLHEAHRMNRRDLEITLALGESCFARKLWREAALHLGKLADHPDAAAHAAAVAVGLVHAAQADVRALRPAQAPGRYEAAVRLDPACAPAWHALAEQATARGDMATAADCLEKEAAATADPQARLRLYDALGDLALGVLEQPERAERCWLAAGDDVAALEKLLALQRRRGAGAERAATCEKLAAAHPEASVRRERLGEAVEAFTAAGDPARARAVAERLAADWPLDEDAIWRASDVALGGGDAAAAAAWLERALSGWDAVAVERSPVPTPRRAELWRRLGDARRALGEPRAAQVAYERAVKAAPDSDGAQAARRGLVTLATAAGRRAIDSLAALVEADQDPGDVLAYGRELATLAEAGLADPHAARAMLELALALGAAVGEPGEEFLAANPARVMASAEAYAGVLDDADRAALVDDEDDAPLAEILETCWEAASLVCPDARTALAKAGVAAERVSPVSAAAAAALYPQVGKALGGPVTILFATTERGFADVSVLLASPPVILLGPKLASRRAQSRSDADVLGDAELRFKLGRVVELARPRRVFAAGTDPGSFALLVAGLWHAFGPGGGAQGAAGVDPAVAAEAERLRAALAVRLRTRLSEQLAGHSLDALDPARHHHACLRAADRAGLLACGHAAVAIAAAGGPAAARHLVRLAASPRYLAVRRKLAGEGVG